MLSTESAGIVFVHDRRRTKTGHSVLWPFACIHLSAYMCVTCSYVHAAKVKSLTVNHVNLHLQAAYWHMVSEMFIFASYATVCARHSPAARCSCRLDGVDPEAVGDVPQCLQCLLVGFVVILHEGKMSSSSAAEKCQKQDFNCVC